MYVTRVFTKRTYYWWKHYVWSYKLVLGSWFQFTPHVCLSVPGEPTQIQQNLQTAQKHPDMASNTGPSCGEVTALTAAIFKWYLRECGRTRGTNTCTVWLINDDAKEDRLKARLETFCLHLTSVDVQFVQKSQILLHNWIQFHLEGTNPAIWHDVMSVSEYNMERIRDTCNA